jgi:hypothetical protein
MALLSPKTMTPAERGRMEQLCRSLQEEKDTLKLRRLIGQLQELLDSGGPERVEDEKRSA